MSGANTESGYVAYRVSAIFVDNFHRWSRIQHQRTQRLSRQPAVVKTDDVSGVT